MSEKALQIAEKRNKRQRRKGKIHPFCAEFQRVARRDKKAFLNDHCKEIEENNRMAKTRDLFKKIRDNKRKFHTKMGTIKDRNCMDLKKQKILRRGGKNTQVQFSSVAESCPTLQPHESQHARPPCPSASPGVHSDSHPSSQ